MTEASHHEASAPAAGIVAESLAGDGRVPILADHVALCLSAMPESGLTVDQILGKVKAVAGILRGREAHDLLGLVATHPNVDPLEDGSFVFKPDTEFTPQTEGFLKSGLDEVPEAPEKPKSDRALTPRQLIRLIKDMHLNPEFQRLRAERGRLANPKRYNNQKRYVRGRSHGPRPPIAPIPQTG